MHDLQRGRHLRQVRAAPRCVEAARDPRAQIAAREVFHRDISMIVGDAEIEDAHHVRMTHLRDQFVFLQEAGELRVLVARGRRVAQHLEHDHLAGPLALRQIHHRGAADRQLAHEAMADESSPARNAIAARPARRSSAAPVLATAQHDALTQHVRQTPMIDALAHQASMAPRSRRARASAGSSPRREIDDRRKAVAMQQVVEPLLAPPALDAVIEQHGVVADCGEAPSGTGPTAAVRGRGIPRPAR